jgi:hypothetical protein
MIRGVGEADTLQQVLEMWVVAQTVHAGIDMKINKPVGMLFEALLQACHGAIIFSQAHVDSGQEIRCDILLLCQSG